MELELNAEIAAVLVGLHPPVSFAAKQASPDAHYLVSSRVAAVYAHLEGLDGDRHAGFVKLSDARTPQYPRGTPIRNTRQVSLIAAEELVEMAERMGVPTVEPEWVGANLVTRGVANLSFLPPLTRLYFPEGATVTLEGQNFPCVYPGRAIESHYPDRRGVGRMFPKAAHGRRGVVGWVEKAGVIREGDHVRIVVPDHAPYPVSPPIPGGVP